MLRIIILGVAKIKRIANRSLKDTAKEMEVTLKKLRVSINALERPLQVLLLVEYQMRVEYLK